MKRLPATLLILLLPATALAAGGVDRPQHQVGTLDCTVLPHSGINLLIHSTRDSRCTFNPDTGGPEEHYKGETGVGFGIDVGISSESTLSYSVLATAYTLGSYRLAGDYSGAGGSASLGLTVGQTAPIRKNDGSITLQPVSSHNREAGVNAGFTYMHLEKSAK